MLFEQPLNLLRRIKMKVTSADELRKLYVEAKNNNKWIYTEETIDDMCRKLKTKEVDCVYVINGELAFGAYYNDPSNLRRNK
jgi:hypothetical protein